MPRRRRTENIMEQKRLTIFLGHYGSGKTNIAVNYALSLAREGKRVCIADLDIVNPYFRTKDSEKELSEAGVTLISPRYANTNVDLPALPPESYRPVQDKSVFGVLDIGGDDRGAYALGRFADAIKKENDYCVAFVANCHRPLTKTPKDALEIMREIEAASGISFTCIVNNSNLGEYTTKETLLDSIEFINELCLISGLPLWMHTAKAEIAAEITEIPVFPLTLQKKYFDLPD